MEPPFLRTLRLGSWRRVGKAARADGRVSVLLCEVLRKLLPASEVGSNYG